MPGPSNQIALAGKQMMAEEVGFDSRQTECQPVLAERCHGLRVRQQSRTRSLIGAPGACCRHMDTGVGVEQSTIVGGEDVAAFALGKEFGEGAPSFGKNLAHAVEKPFDLLPAAEKNSTQDEPSAVGGKGGGIIERQCRAPGTAEHEPSFDAERGAQMLDVGDEVRGCVVRHFAERRRPPGSALIEDHDSPVPGTYGRSSAATAEADNCSYRSAGSNTSIRDTNETAGFNVLKQAIVN